MLKDFEDQWKKDNPDFESSGESDEDKTDEKKAKKLSVHSKRISKHKGSESKKNSEKDKEPKT